MGGLMPFCAAGLILGAIFTYKTALAIHVVGSIFGFFATIVLIVSVNRVRGAKSPMYF